VVTAALNELGSIKLRSAQVFNGRTDWHAKETEWNRERSLASAWSILESAIVENRALEAIDAAEFVLSRPFPLPSGLRDLAISVSGARERLHRAAQGKAPSLPNEPREALDVRVRVLRRRLQSGARNAIGWVDLALAYCSAGQIHKAKGAMRVALNLAPHDRFVIRSAVRLYVHDDEYDKAHDLLIRNPGSKLDPWLSAAEIAVAPLANRDTRLARSARELLEGEKFLPHDLTELTAALGTLELNSGRTKVGKKLLQRSIAHPNDNALAQVEWADRIHKTGLVNPALLATPLSFEARTWSSYIAADFGVCAQQAAEWMEDEPFSTTPSHFLSYLHGCVLHEYAKAIEISRKGLQVNPHNNSIRNNLVLALARSGAIDQAQIELNRISPNGTEEIVVNMATRGLLHIRRGNLDEGFNNYTRAIQLAQRNAPGSWLAFRAWLYLAFETAWAAPNSAHEVLEWYDKRLAKIQRLGLPQHIAMEAQVIRTEIDKVAAKADLFIQMPALIEKLKSGELDHVDRRAPEVVTTKRKPVIHHPRR
jgi:tetratricopeptide (TPR) repeat protein